MRHMCEIVLLFVGRHANEWMIPTAGPPWRTNATKVESTHTKRINGLHSKTLTQSTTKPRSLSIEIRSVQPFTPLRTTTSPIGVARANTRCWKLCIPFYSAQSRHSVCRFHEEQKEIFLEALAGLRFCVKISRFSAECLSTSSMVKV